MQHVTIGTERIRSAGYDAGTMTLEVIHADGTVWRFERVPPGYLEDIVQAVNPDDYYFRHVWDQFIRRRVR